MARLLANLGSSLFFQWYISLSIFILSAKQKISTLFDTTVHAPILGRSGDLIFYPNVSFSNKVAMNQSRALRENSCKNKNATAHPCMNLLQHGHFLHWNWSSFTRGRFFNLRLTRTVLQFKERKWREKSQCPLSAVQLIVTESNWADSSSLSRP